jgi:hypothetical protein
MGRVAKPVIVLIGAVIAAGCTVPLGPWGGPAYDLDTSKIGSGAAAITPRNDADYSNGDAVNAKRK